MCQMNPITTPSDMQLTQAAHNILSHSSWAHTAAWYTSCLQISSVFCCVLLSACIHICMYRLACTIAATYPIWALHQLCHHLIMEGSLSLAHLLFVY